MEEYEAWELEEHVKIFQKNSRRSNIFKETSANLSS